MSYLISKSAKKCRVVDHLVRHLRAQNIRKMYTKH